MSVNIYDSETKTLKNVGGGVHGTPALAMTQAEYNNLDRSILKDGQVIYITDDTSSTNDLTDIISLNGGDLVMKNKLWNIQMGDTGIHDTGSSKDILTLLHFSDIHGNSDNLLRISYFAKQYSDFIDTIVSTGDNVASNFTSDFSFWENNDYIKKNVLFCLGNHDLAATSSVPSESKQSDVPWSWDSEIATQLAAYNRYYKNNISYWGVTQPENAETNGCCYFYKDYVSDGHYKIRIIFVDIGHPTTEQISWFKSSLSSAITNSYSVIIASHFEPGKHSTVPTPFCSREWGTQDSDYLDSNFKTAVTSFIDNGGEFICWLTGHTHDDDFGRLVDDSRQVDSNISTASDHNRSGDHLAKTGLRSQDCFNIMGFDTVDKVIKIMRIGRNYDRYMQCKDTMCYDYANAKLLYPSHE